ncbi:MAG: hypothetical protein IE922_17045 [Sphingomonadales bacterium]|nr:hypothetical protein [Sphingomonadales bacterium]
MLIAHYLFSMLRAWMGSHHPASGAGATGTPSGQTQQPGTVAEPAAPVAQPVTTAPTETTQIGLVIESALGASTGATVGGQTAPGTMGSGAAAPAAGSQNGSPNGSSGGSQNGLGATAALGGLGTALGHAGSAQALSVIAAQIAARQSGSADGPFPAFDDADLAALAALAAGPRDAEAEARALAEDSVLRHRREEWLARITEAAGPGGTGAASASEETAARDTAGAIFAALFGATGASAPAQSAPAAAHRGYGAARALFG